jgi:ParB family chromosome partitioning protein
MANDEYGTPMEIIELARGFLGGIDIDPASNDLAQKIVKATTFYTKERSGLCETWKGKLWLNPPYSFPIIRDFVYKASRHYQAGDIREGLILVNTATETAWYKFLAQRYPMLFTHKRISFLLPEPTPNGFPVQVDGITFYQLRQNRVAQTLFYMGREVKEFYYWFQPIGYPPTGTIKPFMDLSRQSP